MNRPMNPLKGNILVSGDGLTRRDGPSERQANSVFIHREDGHVVQRLRGETFQQHGGLRAGQNHLETKQPLVRLRYT